MRRRAVIRSIDVRSVVRISFAVSMSLWGVVLVGVVALYVLGLVSGGLGGIEGFIASIGFTGFRLSILPFVGVMIVFATLVSAVVALLSGVLANIYNALVPLVGGIRIETSEQPADRPTLPSPQPPTQAPER